MRRCVLAAHRLGRRLKHRAASHRERVAVARRAWAEDVAFGGIDENLHLALADQVERLDVLARLPQLLAHRVGRLLKDGGEEGDVRFAQVAEERRRLEKLSRARDERSACATRALVRRGGAEVRGAQRGRAAPVGAARTCYSRP